LRFLLVLVLLAGCAGKTPAPSAPDPGGLPGKRAPAVERLFARAHALWKGEVCSEPQEAAQLLSEALDADPRFAAAWAYRGLAHSELGQRDEAFDDLTRAILLDPKAEYYAYRGLASLRGGLPSAARRDLEYSLEKDARQHRAWNILGATALQEGNTAQACQHYARGCSHGDCEPLRQARKDEQCK